MLARITDVYLAERERFRPRRNKRLLCTLRKCLRVSSPCLHPIKRAVKNFNILDCKRIPILRK